MKTLNEILKLSIDFLKSKEIGNARRISEDLLTHVLKLQRMDLYLQFDRPLIEEELNLYRGFLKRASQNEPLQYILGKTDFYGTTLKIDRRVLIPRQETEILVDMISKNSPKGTLWDICTGSGCIGISLKKKHTELSVVSTDISRDALDLARENAILNDVEVEFLQGDLFEPMKGKKADWVICNPPYISENEFEGLDPSVKNFEPKLALVGGEKGQEFYERIQKEINAHLNPGGHVFFEIGSSQGSILKRLFPSGKLLSDWAGHPRFFTFTAPVK